MKEPKDYLNLEPINNIKKLSDIESYKYKDASSIHSMSAFLAKNVTYNGNNKDTIKENVIGFLVAGQDIQDIIYSVHSAYTPKISSATVSEYIIEAIKEYNEIVLKIKNNIIEEHLNQSSSKAEEIETEPTVSAAASAANVPVNFQTVVGDPVRQPQPQMVMQPQPVMPEYMKAYQNNNAYYDPAINPFYQATMQQQVSQPQAQAPQNNAADENDKLKDLSKKYLLKGYNLDVSPIQLKKLISLLDNDSFMNELRNQGCCTNGQIKHLKFSKFYRELLEKTRDASDTTNYTNVFDVRVEKILPANKNRKAVIYVNLQDIKSPQDKINAKIVTYKDDNKRKEG